MKHHPYNLKGSSLEVFSALYTLTKKRSFLGTYVDLACWLEIDPKTLRRTIEKLKERGLVYAEPIIEGDSSYEFKAYTIKGYPLPDYHYTGKRSYTNAPVIDAQNVPPQGQNVPNEGQNVPHYTNIYNNNNINNKDFYLGKKVLSKNKDGVYKDEIYPPTWEMVSEYARQHAPTISQAVAKEWYAYAASGGWEMSGGRRIKNWRASLYWYDQRHTDIENEKAAARACVRAQAGFAISPEEEVRNARIKAAERLREEQHDIEANDPEARAMAERICAKFGKKANQGTNCTPVHETGCV